MKPSQLIQAIDCSIDQRLPLFIWGAAGIGKSQIVQQVATERKMNLCDIRDNDTGKYSSVRSTIICTAHYSI